MIYQEIAWSEQSGAPLLTLLQLLPLGVAGLALSLQRSRAVYTLGLIGAAAEFWLAWTLYGRYDASDAAFQFAEKLQIYKAFHYHAAVDGVAVLFILLTAFLTFILTLYGKTRKLAPPGRFVAMVFVVEAALVSQFVSIDMLWFTLASAIQLALAGHMLRAWSSSPDNERAFLIYMQFMAVGLVLLLSGVVLLGWNFNEATGGWTFEFYAFAKTPIQPAFQNLIFFLVFYGLAVRIPLFPMHGWLPLAAEHGATALGPVVLLGLKTGVFGLLRFVFPLMEEAVLRWHEYIVAAAVIGVFYAALLALIQVNVRRLLAFAVVSHSGLLAIGLFSLGQAAFEGGVLLSVNLGLAIAGLLFMTGFIYRRTETMLLSRLGGMFDQFPIIGAAFLISSLSMVGMPGTPGFDAVHLILEAAIERFGAMLTITAALGNVTAAGFLLWAFQRIFLAQRKTELDKEMVPAELLERIIAAILIAVLVVTGFHSEPWLHLIEKSLEGLGALYGHGA